MGGVDDQLIQWFTQVLVAQVEERTDEYLVVPDCQATGIKLRGVENAGPMTRLEIKLRLGLPVLTSFGDSAIGLVERWCKLSQPAEDASAVATLRAALPPVRVGKRRFMLKFAVVDGAVEALPEVPEGVSGCQVELSALSVGEKTWATLGFESFGPPTNQESALVNVAKNFFQERPIAPMELNAETSQGYPSWLQGMS